MTVGKPFDQSIQQFLQDASSAEPTPGGGSVAALAAALGASMLSMVANLTQGKKFEHVTPEMVQVSADMHEAIRTFESLFEQDVASFSAYMAALKRPKSTDDEKAVRTEALQQATVSATRAPLDLADTCVRVLERCAWATAGANSAVLSDLGIAAMLLETAGQSALLTADINLPSIRDGTVQKTLQTEREQLGLQLTVLRDRTLAVVRERMGLH